jgi:holdfast attachment protein HfaA
VALSNRDANGNLVIVDGVMQTGVGSGLYNQSSQTGTLNTTTGVGSSTGSALAIGNNITVVTNGSYNTVIVNATQTNNAPVTAGTVLNGQLNLTNGG